jgi:protein-tyrosine phosphatase
VPILTHPERLSWASKRYDLIERLNASGCLMQLTAGSLMGGFGQRAKILADRMLEEGRVDLLASDAHNVGGRLPGLSKARNLVAERYGSQLADELTSIKPGKILENTPLATAWSSSSNLTPNKAGGRKRVATISRVLDWMRNV